MAKNIKEFSLYSQHPYIFAHPNHFNDFGQLSTEPKNGYKNTRNEWLLTGKGVQTVVFDLESTLVNTEAFTFWGQRLGLGALTDLSSITNLAQQGKMKFNVAVYERLGIARPNREMIKAVEHEYTKQLVPFAQEVVEALKMLGKDVHIVTMGFENTTGKIGELFGVPIHAGKIFLDRNGNFAGHWNNGRLAQPNGKDHMVWKLNHKRTIKPSIAAIGDGMTDMSIENAALRIGFGGCVARDEVREAADVFTYDLPSILVLLAGERNWHKLAVYRDKRIREAFIKGGESILNGRVEFKDAALEIAIRDRLRRLVDERWDRDAVHMVYQS